MAGAKKKEALEDGGSGHITNLKQSILRLSIYMYKTFCLNTNIHSYLETSDVKAQIHIKMLFIVMKIS
jgi:hypothetical protein